jgi:hypothetical protein
MLCLLSLGADMRRAAKNHPRMDVAFEGKATQPKRHDFGLEHARCRRSVPIMETHRDAVPPRPPLWHAQTILRVIGRAGLTRSLASDWCFRARFGRRFKALPPPTPIIPGDKS